MRLATEVSAQKLRGGFYTPQLIAEFILKWGINGSKDASILEPSCGDGVFLQCLQSLKLPFGALTAIEYDAVEAEKHKVSTYLIPPLLMTIFMPIVTVRSTVLI